MSLAEEAPDADEVEAETVFVGLVALGKEMILE